MATSALQSASSPDKVREFYIPDFSNWKQHDSFERAFARLLDALRAEEKGRA